MARIDQLLRIVKEANATDLHLAPDSVPMIRAGGELQKTSHKRLPSETIKQLVYGILTDQQIKQFEQTGDLDLAYSLEHVARFRINVYKIMTGISVAVRLIPEEIKPLEELGFSDPVKKLCEIRSGLVLVTGPTNSGKSTTLAAMVDHINTHFSRHIVTLEDPIEYVHPQKNSLLSQRQIGLHSQSFEAALRAALREDPDVILVGEMRDVETISMAITAAETGLLVLGTLHTCTTMATIDRIVDVFSADRQQQIRIMLADTLRGVVCQQLLPRANGSGRVVAFELMLSSSSVRNLIREARTVQIPSVIQTGRKRGMRLLDSHLKALIDSGQITAYDAVRVATDPAEFYHKITSEDSQPVEI